MLDVTDEPSSCLHKRGPDDRLSLLVLLVWQETVYRWYNLYTCLEEQVLLSTC